MINIRNKHLLLTFCGLLITLISQSQSQTTKQYVDSIKSIWNNNSTPDSVRVHSMLDLVWNEYLFSDFDSTVYYLDTLYSTAKNKDLKQLSALTIHTKGVYFYIGGDYARAIDNYTKALKIRESINDLPGISASLNNLGLIYNDQGENKSAIKYYEQSIKIDEKIKDSAGIGSTLNNIGIAYKELQQFDKAIEYYEKSLEIKRIMNDEKGIASSLNNLGLVYDIQGDLDKAEDYFNRSLEIEKSINNAQGIAASLISLASVHKQKGKTKLALEENREALKIAQRIGAIYEIKEAAKGLYECYKTLNKPSQSLLYHELYIKTRDSILSEENKTEIIKQGYEYEYQKQVATDSIKAAEKQKVTDALLAAQKAKLEKEQNLKYASYVGILILIIFGGFMYNRFKVTRRHKQVIENQKSEVEIKNKEITDSINYARRLQEAILPSLLSIKNEFPESFIFFKPKDIVAGDFYWMELVNDKVFFAVGDCTGHGVPGAMVSVVCSSALSKSVQEEGIFSPSKILERTRDLVINQFDRNDDDINDGMDIALCSYNKKTKILEYAGANNPLWIINPERSSWPENINLFNNNEGGEIKADKQPIGKYLTKDPFTNHIVQLTKGDSIYLFTDGLADQFGGENNKKLKPANLRKYLFETISLNKKDQMAELITNFNTWKKDQEQVDDICILGIKIL